MDQKYKVKKRENTFTFNILCFFHAPLLLRKRCSPVSKSPLSSPVPPPPRLLSKLFQLFHRSNLPLYCIVDIHSCALHIFGFCIFRRERCVNNKGGRCHFNIRPICKYNIFSHYGTEIQMFLQRDRKCVLNFLQLIELSSTICFTLDYFYMGIDNSKFPKVVIFVHFGTVVSYTFLKRGVDIQTIQSV